MARSSTAKRWAWRAAGLISLALGVVGIVVPLLPTTPFLLLAAYCFGRGSQRLLNWLLNHPRFGPPVRDWREHRSISRKAKLSSGVAMVLIVAASVLMGAPRTVIIVQVVVLCMSATFVFTRPTSGSSVSRERSQN